MALNRAPGQIPVSSCLIHLFVSTIGSLVCYCYCKERNLHNIFLLWPRPRLPFPSFWQVLSSALGRWRWWWWLVMVVPRLVSFFFRSFPLPRPFLFFRDCCVCVGWWTMSDSHYYYCRCCCCLFETSNYKKKNSLTRPHNSASLRPPSGRWLAITITSLRTKFWQFF